MYYKDKSGHFTTKENNGGECPHNKYQNMSVDELKGITQKEYRQNTKYEQIVYPTISKKIDDLDEEEMTEQERAKDKFFGVEYVGYKGAEAIEKLLKEKKGHIKAAFHRPEIGDITLVWGNEKGGLFHVIEKRDKLKAQGIGKISGLEMARKIPEIINNGEYKNNNGVLSFWLGNNYKVGIKEKFDEEKKVFIVTAMENLPELQNKK